MTVLAALGDSLSCGEGVGLRVPVSQTWTALVADSLPAGRLVLHATPGARVRDVLQRQAPAVDCQLATLLIGLNDIARGGFDASRFHRDLQAVVSHLTATGASVLVGKLHDPTALLPLPGVVARLARRRVDDVNAAVDELGCWARVHLLSLADVPVLQSAAGWAVDRIHPSPAGHRGLAAAASKVLRGAGWPAARVAEPEPARPPSRWAHSWWLGRHGVPYAATHLRELGQPVVSALSQRR
jgi:lysophospholipase L1-like esterase